MLLGGKLRVRRARRRARSSPTARTLELAGLSFIVDHTPGPHRGSVTFRSPYDERSDVSEVMFSGDLLFAGSIGRTDLPGGDHPTMLRSLRDKVLHARRRHRRAARPRRADDHRSRARDQPLPAGPRSTTEPRDESPEDCEPMAKPTPLSGFPEFLPPSALVEREVIDALRAHLRAARLRQHRDPRRRAARPAAAQGARSTRRSTSCAGCTPTTPTGDSGLGLHFDLTVPFARYVLENAGKLEFPFRRYQIQKAWRGERPQEGRYREFTQADIDIVGRDELPFHHDVEVARVMAEALAGLPLPAAVAPGQQPQADRGLLPRPRARRRPGRDPHHRQARQAAGRRRSPALLVERRRPRPPSRPTRAWRWPTIRAADTSFVDQVARARRRARAARRGPRRARRRRRRLRRRGAATASPSRPTCASPAASTTTPAPSSRSAWRATSASKSIGGGGRYDALASRRPDDVPRRRHLVRRLAARSCRWSPRACCAGSRSVPSARARRARRRGLAAGRRRDRRPRCARAASLPRSPPAPQKFGKQIRYAERRGIPFVWFPGATTAATRSRTSAAATRSPPTPTPGPHPPTTCARTVVSRPSQQQGADSRDPHPRRRHPARRRRRPDRHPRRLGGPSPRPRRRGLPRPARGQRRRPGRRPRRGGRAQPAQRVLHRRSPARSPLRPEGNANPNLPDRRDRGHRRRPSRCSAPPPRCRSRSTTHVDVGEEARLKHRYLDLRRTGPNAALRLRSKVNKAARDVLDAPRLRRDRDPDADPLAPPRAPATSWCRPGCSPAAGTPCRRARSCSSSC